MINSIRQKLKRIVNPIDFVDLQRVKPISNTFGLDRGTPIDRYYIERFLDSNRQYIKGRLLEIAENSYSKKYGSEVVAYEILHSVEADNATIVGDMTKIETLPENYVDCFICTQTFNFIYDVEQAISGAFHILKPGGVLLATVSGISQISRYDMDRWGDYWRFTDKSIKMLFSKIFGEHNVEVVIHGNVLAAVSFLQGIVVEDLPDKLLLNDLDNDYQITIGIIATKKG